MFLEFEKYGKIVTRRRVELDGHYLPQLVLWKKDNKKLTTFD